MLSCLLEGVRACPLPQRALALPDAGVLLVADAHLGKAVSFRRLGVPVPEATTQGTLARLSMYEPVSQNPTITLVVDLGRDGKGVDIDSRDNNGKIYRASLLAPWRQSQSAMPTRQEFVAGGKASLG